MWFSIANKKLLVQDIGMTQDNTETLILELYGYSGAGIFASAIPIGYVAIWDGHTPEPIAYVNRMTQGDKDIKIDNKGPVKYCFIPENGCGVKPGMTLSGKAYPYPDGCDEAFDASLELGRPVVKLS